MYGSDRGTNDLAGGGEGSSYGGGQPSKNDGGDPISNDRAESPPADDREKSDNKWEMAGKSPGGSTDRMTESETENEEVVGGTSDEEDEGNDGDDEGSLGGGVPRVESDWSLPSFAPLPMESCHSSLPDADYLRRKREEADGEKEGAAERRRSSMGPTTEAARSPSPPNARARPLFPLDRRPTLNRRQLMEGIGSRDSINAVAGFIDDERGDVGPGSEGDGGSTEAEAGEEEEEKGTMGTAIASIVTEDLLSEGQRYLAMSMLVYIYALLREMSLLGYTSVEHKAIDVNRWKRWYPEGMAPQNDSDDEDEDADINSVGTRGTVGTIESDHTGPSLAGTLERTIASTANRKKKKRLEKYLGNTRTAGSIIRCVLEELEKEHKQASETGGSAEGQDNLEQSNRHDISIIKEFQHWVDDSRVDQPDDAAEEAIKELQRRVAKKRWKRTVRMVMLGSRFKLMLAATAVAKEIEEDEKKGKRPSMNRRESVREIMERKKVAAKRQLEREMRESGNSGNVNTWFTLQKRVIQSHFDDGDGDNDGEGAEEDDEDTKAKKPDQNMVDLVLEQTLPSFFKPDSVLSLMMEQGLEVVYFGDRHPNEAIYCIMVCRKTKTVTVVFRGSVTAHNWLYNMKLMMTEQPNPLAYEQYAGREDKFRLHTGFGLYMLRRRKDIGMTKIDEIFNRIDHVGRELCENGKYRVAVTGHSLGGALSTIFSFYAACDPRFTTTGPVRTFTFAAPRVGDDTFRLAYEHLERTGRLRHARFSNTKDIVPLIPPCSIEGGRIGKWYRHVGLQVKLHERGMRAEQLLRNAVDATYPRNKSLSAELGRALVSNNVLLNLTNLAGFGRNHSLSEHQRRLNFARQYRVGLAETEFFHDARKQRQRKLKSLEEYYQIRAGFSMLGEGAMEPFDVSAERRLIRKRLLYVVLQIWGVMAVWWLCRNCPDVESLKGALCEKESLSDLCKGLGIRQDSGELSVKLSSLDVSEEGDLVQTSSHLSKGENVAPVSKHDQADDGGILAETQADDREVLAETLPLDVTMAASDENTTDPLFTAETDPTSDVGGGADAPSSSNEECACNGVVLRGPKWGVLKPVDMDKPLTEMVLEAERRSRIFAESVEKRARALATTKVASMEGYEYERFAPIGSEEAEDLDFSNSPVHVLGPLLKHLRDRATPFRTKSS